jgi:hypothetical protein
MERLIIGGRADLHFSLPVEVKGRSITVGAGSVCALSETPEEFEGGSYELPAKIDWPLTVHGYLAREKANNKLFLLVDEVFADGKDRPYAPRPNDPFEIIDQIFHVHVPPKSKSLAEAEIRVHEIEPPPPPPAPSAENEEVM